MILAPTGGKYNSLTKHRLAPKNFTENLTHQVFNQSYELANTVQEYGPISNLAVNPKTGNFAATSGYNVSFYNGSNLNLDRKISDFKQNCFGGEFNEKGLLYICGSGESTIRLYSTSESLKSIGKSALRSFRPKLPNPAKSRVVKFRSNFNQILGFFDNGYCNIFDIQTGEIVHQFAAHSERVQCGSFSSSNVLATGSYDKFIKLWDGKNLHLNSGKEILKLNQNFPVESLCWLGNTNLLATSGNTKVKFWDIRNTSQELETLESKSDQSIATWTKPVMALEYSEEDNLLLAGSLDSSIKTIDPNTLSIEKFKVCSAPILSMKILKNESRVSNYKNSIIVGLKTGNIEIYKDKKISEVDELDVYEYEKSFSKGFLGQKRAADKQESDLTASKPKKVKTQQMKSYENSQKVLTKHFRKFKFRTAFSYSLDRWFLTDHEYMEPLLNCLFELQRLKALTQAINNQEDVTISRLVSYFNKFIFNKQAHERIISANISKANIVPLFSMLIELIIDLGYSNEKFYPLTAAELSNFSSLIEIECKIGEELIEMDGILEMFLCHMDR